MCFSLRSAFWSWAKSLPWLYLDKFSSVEEERESERDENHVFVCPLNSRINVFSPLFSAHNPTMNKCDGDNCRHVEWNWWWYCKTWFVVDGDYLLAMQWRDFFGTFKKTKMTWYYLLRLHLELIFLIAKILWISREWVMWLMDWMLQRVILHHYQNM